MDWCIMSVLETSNLLAINNSITHRVSHFFMPHFNKNGASSTLEKIFLRRGTALNHNMSPFEISAPLPSETRRSADGRVA